jgi:peptidoglycan/xylan/chitin deacetylase (PgdA/CDA1 family)
MDRLVEILSLGVPAAAGTAWLAWAVHGTVSPTSNFWGPVQSRAIGAPPAVSLTFDDGPGPQATERILDLLAEMRVKVAFFVIGQNARRWPELVRRMDAEGHIVANHTFDHAHLGLFGGSRYWKKQLAMTGDLIEKIIGKRPALFRPPMGIRTRPVHVAARAAGLSVITWTRRAIDGIQAQTPEILDRLVAPSQPGEILLLHDGIDPSITRWTDPARTATIEAIRPLVNGLRQRGLEPQRLDQLLGIEPYLCVAGEHARR